MGGRLEHQGREREALLLVGAVVAVVVAVGVGLARIMATSL